MIIVHDIDNVEKIVRELILNGYVVTVQAVKKSFPYEGVSHFEVQFEKMEVLKDGSTTD